MPCGYVWKTVTVTLGFFAFTSTLGIGAETYPDAYSRRGYKLGMTLQAFKATPYPDKSEIPSAFPLCSDSPQDSRDPHGYAQLSSDELRKVGVVKCRFFQEDPPLSLEQLGLTKEQAALYPNLTEPRWIPANLKIADVSTSTSFYFLGEAQGDVLLYRITTQGNADSFSSLIPILTKAFGAPTHRIEQWQSRAGSVFPNDVFTWQNSVSKTEISHYSDTLDEFEMSQTLTPLIEKINGLLEKQNTEAAGKI